MNAYEIRKTTSGISLVLYAASFLVLCVGISLYFFSEQTRTYFAWTIQPPLTAAFLGGGYLASFVLEMLAARERLWSNTRVAIPGVWIFTALTLIITILHLGRFHFDAELWITRLGTWTWMGVYTTVPIVMGLLWVLQIRKSGIDAPRESVLPPWLRVTLLAQGSLTLLCGIAMILVPQTMIALWPWQLSVLTSQAIGAWGIGIGAMAIQAMVENDWRRIVSLMPAYALLGGLQLLAVVRYPEAVDWTKISGKLYLVVIASVLGVGLYGTLKTMRHHRARVA